LTGTRDARSVATTQWVVMGAIVMVAANEGINQETGYGHEHQKKKSRREPQPEEDGCGVPQG